MPWVIQKIQKILEVHKIQVFLDAEGNPENHGNPGFPGCRGESRKSGTSRMSWEI